MIQGSKCKTAQWRRRLVRGMAAVACAAALCFTTSTRADDFFSFTSDPLTGNPPTVATYVPAPFLTPTNASAVSTFLSSQPNKGLMTFFDASPATINTVYGSQNVRHTFSDFENANAIARTTALVSQIKASAGTGPAVLANTSYVGNWNLYPITNDPTRPLVVVDSLGHYTTTFTNADYTSSGVNMANEALYPGSPDFRSPAMGNSTAPNIRSSMFTLPLTRLSLVTAALPSGHAHVPYIARFNNAGNLAIQNGLAPDGQAATIFGAGQTVGGQSTDNQLLSRGDFKALVAHYRARGADGFNLLDPGVVGYTRAQMEQDASDGWHLSKFDAVFAAADHTVATLDTVINVVGTGKDTLEHAGVVWSGVYSLTQGKLAILLSNMGENPKSITIPFKVGGKTIGDTFAIAGGDHQLLDFTAVGTQWVLQNPGGTLVFADSNRDGVGVPEPSTVLGGMLVLGMGAFARRRRA